MTDSHTVLSLVMPWLSQRDRASLAAVSRSCRLATEYPCRCTAVRVVLPPLPSSAPYAWLATHRTDSLVVSHRPSTSPAEFARAVGSVPRWPQSAKISCLATDDASCGAVSAVLGAGVRDLTCRLGPGGGDVELRLDARTQSLDIALDATSVRLTGDASGLRRLTLRARRFVRHNSPPDRGFSALETATLDNVCFHALLCDAAPKLRSLTVGNLTGPWPVEPPTGYSTSARGMLLSERPLLALTAGAYIDPGALAGVPATAVRLLAPFEWRFNWAGSALARSVQSLELDMAHWRSEEFALGKLAEMPRMHTLRLANVRRLSSLDDLIEWSMVGLPPSLRAVEVHVCVEHAVDSPREIRRYAAALVGTYGLDFQCVLS